MRFNYSISQSLRFHFYKNIGPKFIWGAFVFHFLKRKIEFSYDLRKEK